MKEEIVKFREVWVIFAMLAVIITLLLINKFPINIEMRENRQVWEANCNCKCEPQEAKPCINWSVNFSMPKSFNVNYSWSKWLNTTEECRTCWESPHLVKV